MINNIKQLEKYLRLGGGLKQTFHINPKAATLGQERTVKVSRKGWEFSDNAWAPYPLPEIIFGEGGFDFTLNGRVIISYTYLKEG
jgi:hypothetical protein